MYMKCLLQSFQLYDHFFLYLFGWVVHAHGIPCKFTNAHTGRARPSSPLACFPISFPLRKHYFPFQVNSSRYSPHLSLHTNGSIIKLYHIINSGFHFSTFGVFLTISMTNLVHMPLCIPITF